MNYIRVTKENIDKEHICCAMSGKQSDASIFIGQVKHLEFDLIRNQSH